MKKAADEKPAAPARPAHSCKAHGCPMVGAIDGLCHYHVHVHTSEWQAVSQALRQCSVLTDEIHRARRAFVRPAGADVDLINGHVDALERIRYSLSEDQLQFLAEHPAKDYSKFIYQLEMLVGKAVIAVVHRRRDERAPAPAKPPTPATPASQFVDQWEERYP